MRSHTKFKYLFIFSFLFLFIGCSRPTVKSYQSYVDAEEMCKILEKKRTQKAGKRDKPNWHLKNSKDTPLLNRSEVTGLPNQRISSPIQSSTSTEFISSRNKYPELMASNNMEVGYIINDTNSEANIYQDTIKSSSEFPLTKKAPRTKHPKSKQFSKDGSGLSFIKNYHYPGTLLVGAILAGMALFWRSKSITKISGWAQVNKSKSRWSIAGIHSALIPLMAFLGNEVYLEGGIIPDPVLYGSMGLLGTSVALSTYNFPRRYYYNSMRALTVSTALSGSLMVMHAGNHYEIENIDRFEISTPEATFASVSAISLEERNFQIAQEPKKKGMSNGAKIALTILVIAASFGLFMLLGGLACNLSCAGYEVAAWLVFLGGNIGNVALMIYAIKSIFGKNKKQKQAQAV